MCIYIYVYIYVYIYIHMGSFISYYIELTNTFISYIERNMTYNDIYGNELNMFVLGQLN